jgi:hypothetical protein
MEQEQKTIAEKIILKLEQDKVTPIARWHFTLRNSSFWTLWGLSVALGACATAATIFVFLNSGWKYQGITHDSFIGFLVDVVPVFWIFSIAAMIVFGYFNIRNTTRGYRFSFYLVVLSSVLASFVGGTILYTVGVAGDIDDLRRPLPFSNSIVFVEEGRWNNEARGLISGIITSFDEEKQILTIKNFKLEDKNISTIELGYMDIERIKTGEHVRVIGGFDKNNTFVACVVLPVEKPGIPYTPPQIHLPKDSQIERKQIEGRISICKDVRPYQRYKEILITN